MSDTLSPGPEMENLLKAYSQQRRKEAVPPLQMPAEMREELRQVAARTHTGVVRPRVKYGWYVAITGAALAGVLLAGIWVVAFIRANNKWVLPSMQQEKVAEAAPSSEMFAISTAETKSVMGETVPAAKKADNSYGLLSETAESVANNFTVATNDLASTTLLPPAGDLKHTSGVELFPAKTVPSAGSSGAENIVLPGVLGAAKMPEEEYMIAQRFARLDTGGPTRPGAVQPPAAKLLIRFRVEEAGDRLTFSEPDGSVYSGFLNRNDLGEEAAPTSDPNLPASVGDTAKPPSSLRRYFFRVEGESKTLKQPVVLFGNFLEQYKIPLLPVLKAKKAPKAEQAAMLIQLINSKIEAKLLVGTSTESKFQAQPVLEPAQPAGPKPAPKVK